MNGQFENTIELLEAEIDSLKDAYKSENNKEQATIYSSRILEYKKAIIMLSTEQAINKAVDIYNNLENN